MTSSGFKHVIRPVSIDDACVVAVHRFFDDWGDEARLSALRETYAQWLEKMIASGHYIGRLVEAEGRVIAGAGAVLLDWGATWSDPNPLKARIANVFTDPDYRRRGLARDVVTQTLSALRDRGVRSVSLASTQAASGLYASLGFKARSEEFSLLLT